MSDRPVVVTGAGGFIGWAVATELHANGVPVLGIVRSPPSVATFNWRVMDLEVDSLAAATSDHMLPEMVIHCAASIPLAPFRLDDNTNADATRRIDAGVVDACAQLGCRLTYMSSCILYDPADPETKTERSTVRATAPYAAAKLAGELQAASLGGSVVMRIPSPVGGFGRRRSVFERFVEQAVHTQSLEVWGTGHREQDFIHVADIAGFVRRVLSRRVEGIFNVASGLPITMRGLADTIVNVIGSGSVVLSGRPDPQEGHTARYDIQAAQQLLNWTPHLDIPAMIEQHAARTR